MSEARFLVARIDVILDLEHLHAKPEPDVLNEVGQISRSRRACGITYAHDWAPNHRKEYALQRNRVRPLRKKQFVATEREKINCRKRSCAPKVSISLARRLIPIGKHRMTAEIKALSSESREPKDSMKRDLSEIRVGRVRDRNSIGDNVSHWRLERAFEQTLERSLHALTLVLTYKAAKPRVDPPLVNRRIRAAHLERVGFSEHAPRSIRVSHWNTRGPIILEARSHSRRQ